MFHSFHKLKCDTFRNPNLSHTRVPQIQYMKRWNVIKSNYDIPHN